MAADLAARPYTKAPVAPAAVYNWTGFYLGIVGGGAWEKRLGCPEDEGRLHRRARRLQLADRQRRVRSRG
jgi:hypothetical protein